MADIRVQLPLVILVGAVWGLLAGPSPASAQSAAPPLVAEHLLERLDSATLVIPKGEAPAKVSRHIQPFHLSYHPEEAKRWHRRVVLYDGSNKFRDMREALVLPPGSSAAFPVATKAGDTFAAVLLVGGKAGEELEATVSCATPTGTKNLWQKKVGAQSLGKLRSWPEEFMAAVTVECTSVTLSTKCLTPKGCRSDVIWHAPRIERRVAGGAPPYNIVMVVVDAMRGDTLGASRTGMASVSPNMDKLVASGTDFMWGHSAANTTLMSMNILITGAHARAASFIALWWSGKDRRQEFYKARPPYITRILHAAGYRTMAAVNNHLYFADYKYAVDPGFDVVQDCQKDQLDHPLLTDAAIKFIKGNAERRFFVQLNLLGPHQPYNPPAECVAKARKALKGSDPMFDPKYIGEICWVDIHVGKLMDALKETGLDKNTIVVLTADHGEVMDGRHQCRSESQQQNCAKLHGLTLYNEEIHVPFVFSLPGTIRGQVVKTPVSHPDIAPTLLALNNLPVPEQMSGRSLVGALLRGEPLDEIPVYAERWNARALRWGKWKLIWHTSKDDICPHSVLKTCRKGHHWFELYDIEADPHERTDLSTAQPDKLKEMKAKVEEIIDGLYKKSGGIGPNP